MTRRFRHSLFWFAGLLAFWAGPAAAGTIGLVSDAERPQLLDSLRREIPGDTVTVYDSASRIPAGADAPGIVIVFKPRDNQPLADSPDRILIRVAEDDEEAAWLATLPPSPHSWRMVALPTMEERVKILQRLFPLAHRLAILCGDAWSATTAGAPRRAGTQHITPVPVTGRAEISDAVRNQDAALYAGPPSLARDLRETATQLQLPLVVAFPPLSEKVRFTGVIRPNSLDLAKSIAARIREAEQGGEAPRELLHVSGAEISIDLNALKDIQGHLDLSAVEAMHGRIVSGTETVEAIAVFLANYKAALETRDEAAYTRLWSGTPSEQTLSGFRNLMGSASGVRLEFSAPKIISYEKDPDTVEFRIGQWYTLVDRKSGRSVSTPRVTIRFALVPVGDQLLIREVSLP